MHAAMRRRARQLGPIKWRDERLAEQAEALRATRAELRAARRAQVVTPSYRAMVHARAREYTLTARYQLYPSSPMLQVARKLYTKAFAASHGVPAPGLLAVWPTVDDIDLTGLPDRFVVKADGGANSRAVFPLRRTGDGRFAVISTGNELTEGGLREAMAALGGRARAPYFAEEMVDADTEDGLPNDVKVFTCDGVVLWTMLRRVDAHGGSALVRFVDEHGVDLGPIARDRSHDATIEVPDCYPELVEAARHLSRASGLDFCRVDLYSTSTGPVFGELTVAPGGTQHYARPQDRELGTAWEEARVRLAAEIAGGRPPGVLFGDHEAPAPYAPSTDPRDPGSWTRQTVSCASWCVDPPDPGGPGPA